ncbi:MAG: hypothetical protein KF716_27380 [Anaerolineae bacterium]|nr:hypothetical protein [Anaerolineae bacterium]
MMHIPEQDKQRLQHIATLIENGNIAEAKSLLDDLQRTSPPSAPLWYLVSFTVDTKAQQAEAINRALALDPNYVPAQRALEELGSAKKDVAAQSWLNGTSYAKHPPFTRQYSQLWTIGIVLLILLIFAIVVGVMIVRLPNSSDLGFSATVAPSLTPHPSPLKLVSGKGRVEAHLFSGYNDPIGQERKEFVLKGTANLNFSNDTLAINVMDEAQTSAEWSFQYFAPDFQVNKLYENTVNHINKDKTKPHLDISSPYGACNNTIATGKFVVEQQYPTLIVSFTHICSGSFKGSLIFTPDTVSPSPTGDMIFFAMFSEVRGEAIVDMRSSVEDLQSAGLSIFTVKGPSVYSYDNEGFSLTVVDTQTPKQGKPWKFRFYAPNLVNGHVYENAHGFSLDRSDNIIDKDGIRIGVLHDSGAWCKEDTGSFIFDVQGSAVTITFVRLCKEDPRQRLEGTIHFRPLTALTPTPSIPPALLFTPKEGLGDIHVEFDSASADPVGGGKGKFTLDRVGQLDIENVDTHGEHFTIRFHVRTEKHAYDDWILWFWAPLFQLNKPYTVYQPDQYAGRDDGPALSIHHVRRNDQFEGCTSLSGQFTIEQQSPTIIISFRQLCAEDPAQLLQGKLFFTPYPPRTSTPTPTITLTLTHTLTTTPTMESFNHAVNDIKSGSVDLELKWTTTGQTYARTEVSTAWSNAQQGIVLIIPGAPTSWGFRFYAPTYLENKRYEHVPIFSLRNKSTPGMSIVGSDNERCQDIDGTFKIRRDGEVYHGAVLVIEFSQICKSDPAWNLQGTIRFTPN